MKRPNRRSVSLAVALLMTLGACGGGGGGGEAGGSTTSSAPSSLSDGPLRQEQFHADIVASIRLFVDELLPERFKLVDSSIQLVDITQGEVEFKTRRDFGEFAREKGLLGFGGADFEAAGGIEFWGLLTYVFKDGDGARATFERFSDLESVSVDGTLIDTQSRPFDRDGATGTMTVETYEEVIEGQPPVRSLALRASMVDDNVLHYLSAALDPPVDGLSELERLLAALVGSYRELFRQFIAAGGTDAPTTTTTRDPTYVPGGLPGDG